MPLDADYIIAGAGCAGLSLAVQLRHSGLPFSKVLIFDKVRKTENDRTWCFWTSESKPWFKEIIFKQWDQFEFRCGKFRQSYYLEPYCYQMIRGIDFYTWCLKDLEEDKRFEFIYDEILEISSNAMEASISTRSKKYKSGLLFNSVIQTIDKKPKDINYLQHFKGWLIETEQAVFKNQMPVFMDFETSQPAECRFFYLIPHSGTKALVEYTGFSKDAWEEKVYDEAIANYIDKNFPGTNYKIIETEHGKIPMYDSVFINPFGPRVINTGSAGGNSKPSTGYTFYFIQQHTQQIIAALRENKMPDTHKRPARFRLYDKILLEVLDKKELPASKIFLDLFRKNKVQDILDFLNEESSVLQELRIMNSVNKVHFLKPAFKKLL